MSEVTIELTNRQRTYLERQFTLGADEDANSGSDAFGLMQKLRNAMGAAETADDGEYVPRVGDAIQVQYAGHGAWYPHTRQLFDRVVTSISEVGLGLTDSDGNCEVEFSFADHAFRLDERDLEVEP